MCKFILNLTKKRGARVEKAQTPRLLTEVVQFIAKLEEENAELLFMENGELWVLPKDIAETLSYHQIATGIENRIYFSVQL